MAGRKQHNGDLIAFVQQNSSKICRKKSWKTQASELGLHCVSLTASASTMKPALNEDLCYHSYERHRGQLLTEKACANRLTKWKKLLSKVKHPAEPQTIKFFSGEKNFCQDQKHNTQNNRWLAYSPKDTPHFMQTKFSKTVMVFRCVSCEGYVLPLHFFRGSQVELKYLHGVATHCS